MPLPLQLLQIARSQDFAIELRALIPETVRLVSSAAIGVTALAIDADHPAFSSGEKFLFGNNIVVTLNGACGAGVASLPVTATSGQLDSGEIGYRLRDLTGYTIEFEVLHKAGDAAPVISITGGSITILTQSGDDRGKYLVSGLAVATTNLVPKNYYCAAWRRNAGTSRPIFEGTFVLRDAGFL